MSNYGVHETNPLDPGQPWPPKWSRQIDWADPELKRITRLRLLSDPGYPRWDVSYCFGVTRDGETVKVDLGFSDLPKRGMRGAIVEAAKRDGVYARGLGIFDAISTLI